MKRITLVVVLAISGCTTGQTYKVLVNAHDGAPAPDLPSFTVQGPNGQNLRERALAAQSAEIVASALVDAGMHRAKVPTEANIVVTVSYAVGGAQPVREWQYQSTPSNSGVTSGGVTSDGTLGGRGTVDRGVSMGAGPRIQLVCESLTFYEKRLQLAAYANTVDTARTPRAEYWRVSVSTRDPSDNLSQYVPMLASTAAHYVEVDSKEPVTIVVRANGRPIAAAPATRTDVQGPQQGAKC